MKKLIQAMLFALTGSLLSAFYISMVQATDVTPDEIQISGTY